MKEKIEKMLKSQLKRKLTITTATLIAFLLSSNIAMAGQIYQVGNNGIKRDNSGIWEDATEKLKKADLFKIEGSTIENKLKDISNFELLAEVNKTFINKGKISRLRNKGTGKIENRANIFEIYSKTESNIDNFGLIREIILNGNIFNRTNILYLDSIDAFNKGITIENEGRIYTLYENKKVKNYGSIYEVVAGKVADTEKIDNYGIINFGDTADYTTLNGAGKLDNKGIVVNDLSNFTASGNTDNKGRAIKNYKNQAIVDTKITNGILNAYKGTVDNDLTLNNNSIFNMREGIIKADKKLSFNNSTVNMGYGIKFKDGVEIEFKDNSSIGLLGIDPFSPTDKLKSITIDNTTAVGGIVINGNIEAINLVPNDSIANKDKVLRINNFRTEVYEKVNTNISTNVDLLGDYSQLGNISVKEGGRLTITVNSLNYNGVMSSLSSEIYKKDIKIEGNGKIIIGIDPYNIGVVENLGKGNNLTDSVKGQKDTMNPSERLAQDKLNIDADSLLHDIVIMPEEEVTYEKGLPSEYKAKVRNKYKVIEATELAKPLPPEEEGSLDSLVDYPYLNNIYLSLLDA
ncbi:MAG: autotransporter outer membrane beta-barrel domain-containing protein, partial [Fusobacterium sp.]|nr:autotransporter outer membrane beta-barrel domain-containing protein [Fusobacterium sp.]